MCKEDSEVIINTKSSHLAYVNLAIAVINQAKRDTLKEGHWKEDALSFLQSDWYINLQTLIDIYKNPEGNTL